MLLDWLHGDLHHWAIFCCSVATLGLIGAAWASVGVCFGKGALGFLNGSGRQPQVIVVNGSGQYVQPQQKRGWGLGKTYLLFAAIFSGGPMLTLLAMWLYVRTFAFFDWTDHNRWVFALPGVLFVLVGAFWWLIRHDRQREANQWSELRALPAVVEAPAVAPIWTAPSMDTNWAERP